MRGLQLVGRANPLVSYQPALMLTHEERVNAGRHEAWFCARPPACPARDTSGHNGRTSRPLRRLVSFLIAFCLLWGTPCGATTLLAELDTSSPAATLQSFLTEQPRVEALYNAYREAPSDAAQFAMAEVVLRLGRAIFDLREEPPATRDKMGAAAIGYLTDILARLPAIELSTVPGGPGWPGGSLPARWTVPGTELRIVRLADGPRTGDYVFSAETLAHMPSFHARIINEPILQPGRVSNWVAIQQGITGAWLAPLRLDTLPLPFAAILFGAPVWKIILSLLVAVVILAIVAAWRRFVAGRAARLTPWRSRALRFTVPALLAVLVLAGHIFIMWQVVPPNALAFATTTLAVALIYLAAAWAAWCACWLIAEAVIASPAFPDSTYDAHLVRIVARVASLLSLVLIILYGANDIGVPALGLLAGVSIGGVALALAAQSTAANLLGGIVIFGDRPFRVGEAIRFGANAGTVESIGPRSTHIRGVDGALMTVPNADIANAQLVNVSARTSSLFQHRIGLPAELSATQIEALLVDLRRRIVAHPMVETSSDQSRVHLVKIGSSTSDAEIEVFARLATTATGTFLAAQEALLLDIHHGIEAARADVSCWPAAKG